MGQAWSLIKRLIANEAAKAGVFTPMLVLTQMEVHMANDVIAPKKIEQGGGDADESKVTLL